MDIRCLIHPDDPDDYVPVDLDSRVPLENTEAVALRNRLSSLIANREMLNEAIRKTNRRLLLSAETKAKEAKDGTQS